MTTKRHEIHNRGVSDDISTMIHKKVNPATQEFNKPVTLQELVEALRDEFPQWQKKPVSATTIRNSIFSLQKRGEIWYERVANTDRYRIRALKNDQSSPTTATSSSSINITLNPSLTSVNSFIPAKDLRSIPALVNGPGVVVPYSLEKEMPETVLQSLNDKLSDMNVGCKYGQENSPILNKLVNTKRTVVFFYKS